MRWSSYCGSVGAHGIPLCRKVRYQTVVVSRRVVKLYFYSHSDINGWTIQLGITRRHAHSFYGQKMKVRRVVPHPQYNMGHTHDNDVALFQVSAVFLEKPEKISAYLGLCKQVSSNSKVCFQVVYSEQ